MKKYKVGYSEDTPVNDIIVEAENEREAYDRAKDILSETLDYDFDMWNVEEIKEPKKN